MTMNAIAVNIGCFTCAQATGRAEERPRSGRPCVTRRSQDRYIRNTHLRNHFQTATATAANIHNTHNNRISGACTRPGGLSARRPYVGCVLARRHRVNRVNLARLHNNGIAFFSLTSRGLPFIEMMAGFENPVREINVMSTCA